MRVSARQGRAGACSGREGPPAETGTTRHPAQVTDASMKASVCASTRVFSRSGSECRGPRKRTASPWTVAHVGYSMFGRRSGSSRPAPTRPSRAALRWSSGRSSSLPALGAWRSVAVNAVSNRPGSARAKPRYALPTARSRSRAPIGVRVPRAPDSFHRPCAERGA